MPKSIVICASFRFYEDVLALQRRLEEAGIRTEIPIPNYYLNPRDPTRLQDKLLVPAPLVFETFWRSMEMHHQRIIETDIVYVYGGIQGYVGNGVSSEMGFSHALAHHCPGQKPRTILSSHELADIAMKGFVEEVVSPDMVVKRLS
jgi:hypothetical protein